jgi:hypothetical protein
MRVFVISHKLFNQKTGRLTLTGEEEMERIANFVNGKIPADDNIKIITEVDDGTAKQHQLKSAEIFSNVLCFEHETSTDPIEDFKKKTVYGYKREDVQAVILITNQNISKLNWFFTKTKTTIEEEKIKFPEGKLIYLEITNGYIPLAKMHPS